MEKKILQSKRLVKGMAQMLILALLTVMLPVFGEKAKADQRYLYYFKKVSVKQTGWYKFTNANSSAKAANEISIMKKKSKKLDASRSSIAAFYLPKKKSVEVYLKKGTYYLREEWGEQSGKKKNGKIKVSKTTKQLKMVTNKTFKIYGQVEKTPYLEYQADMDGVVEFVTESGLIYDNGTVETSLKNTLYASDKKEEISHSGDAFNKYFVEKGKLYYFSISKLGSGGAFITPKYSYERRESETLVSNDRDTAVEMTQNDFDGKYIIGYKLPV